MSPSTETELDVRPVQPEHRLETIMGAYESLPRGATLNLIFDHDPTCMYYALAALSREAPFTFEYRENGPEVWRVEVQKRWTMGGGLPAELSPTSPSTGTEACPAK